MMLTTSKSKQSTIYYVTKSLYNGGKRTSKVIERLGSLAELERRFGQTDTIQKARLMMFLCSHAGATVQLQRIGMRRSG